MPAPGDPNGRRAYSTGRANFAAEHFRRRAVELMEEIWMTLSVGERDRRSRSLSLKCSWSWR
jgi:hypothetical protein